MKVFSDFARYEQLLWLKFLGTMCDLAARAVTECNLKCVPKARDGELTVAEMACIDRCVPKYIEAHEQVGRELREHRGGKPVDYP